MRNRIIIMIISASLSFAGIGQVMAAGQFYDYNITAPKFGGSTAESDRADMKVYLLCHEISEQES